MKKMIVGTLIALTCVTSMSQAMNCKENGTGIDNGYNVYVSKDGKRAVVEEISIAGPKTLATLVCARSNVKAPCCDQEYVSLSCYEPNLKDIGYSFVVKQGGFAGLTTGTLSEISLVGSKQVAATTCGH